MATTRSGKVGVRNYSDLRPAQKRARGRALQAIGQMRQGESLTRAAAKAHTTPRTVKRWLDSELTRTDSGRYAVTKGDRVFTVLNVITTDGPLEVPVRGSRQRAKVARHANAVRRFLRTGDDEALRKFEGEKVGGYLLETDPEVLEERGRLTELDYPDLYAGTV